MAPYKAMRLLRIPEPFDHLHFIFEPKLDGFRALAHIEGNRCSVISRNGNVFKSWPQLCEELAQAVRCRSAVLDGEICCLNPDGRTNFKSLLFRRERPYFYAFDLLMLNGRDLRGLPLTERKRRLAAIMPPWNGRVLFLDSLAERGRDLFREACERDLEGIVAKWTHGTYQTDTSRTSWLKIKNPEYSQMVDRHELFAVSRGGSRTTPKAATLALVSRSPLSPWPDVRCDGHLSLKEAIAIFATDFASTLSGDRYEHHVELTWWQLSYSP